MSQNSMRHIMQTLTNRIVSRTLPNNPQSGGKGKAAVNKLRQRIKENTIPQDYLRAYPNDAGKPIWSEAQGQSPLPVVVVQNWKGRPRKGRKLPTADRVLTGDALKAYVKANTRMKRKGSAVMRVRNDDAKVVWTTKPALNKLAKDLQARAGNDIFGWNSLAEIAGSNAINKSVNLNKANYDKPGGSASFTPSTFSSIDDIRISAKDDNAPAETVAYNQRCIDKMMPQWVNNIVKSELKFMTPSRLAKGLKLPSDIQLNVR